METNYFISKYCKIEDNTLEVDGNKTFELVNAPFSDFSKSLYKYIELDYPKFFKMDSLSKLAMLGSETILKDSCKKEEENEIAIIFANRSSSLDTDVKHQDAICDSENYFPSPAVFVYTLPNICIGEVSIKYNLKSENAFFVFDEYNTTFMMHYANQILQSNKAEKVLCGWVEYFQENYKAVLYIVEKNGLWSHDIETINKIFS